jgi:hypothetical protein
LTRTDNRVKDPEKRKSERKKCLGIVGNDVEFKGDVDDWYHEYKRKPENAKKEHNAVVCGSAEKNEDYHITRRFRPLDSEGVSTSDGIGGDLYKYLLERQKKKDAQELDEQLTKAAEKNSLRSYA